MIPRRLAVSKVAVGNESRLFSTAPTAHSPPPEIRFVFRSLEVVAAGIVSLQMSRPLIGQRRCEKLLLAVHCWQISDLFGRSDASRVAISVRGDVVNLASRSADIHELPLAEAAQGGS